MNGTVESVTDTTVTIGGKAYNYVTPYTTANGKYMTYGAKTMVGVAPNYKINAGDYVEFSWSEINGVHIIKYIKKVEQPTGNVGVQTPTVSGNASRDDSIRLQHCEKVVAGFLTEHPNTDDAEIEKFVNRVSAYGHMLFEKR